MGNSFGPSDSATASDETANTTSTTSSSTGRKRHAAEPQSTQNNSENLERENLEGNQRQQLVQLGFQLRMISQEFDQRLSVGRRSFFAASCHSYLVFDIHRTL